MDNSYELIRSRKIILIVIAVAMFLMVGCWEDTTNIYREHLTFQEAQSLVTFPICVPGYIPPGIDPNPNIINQAEGPDIIPEENKIRLQYKWLDNQQKAFEVFQRYTNHRELELQYPDEIRTQILERSKATLFYWMTDTTIILSETRIRGAMGQMKIEADVFQTDQTIWWFFEIAEPEQFRSTETKWINNDVEYWILSYLPGEEIKAITESMMNCPTR